MNCQTDQNHSGAVITSIVTARAEGYYWLLSDNNQDDEDKWIVWHWDTDAYYDHPENGRWTICGNDRTFDDSHFTKIGKKISQ
jgi:hypothetical protein